MLKISESFHCVPDNNLSSETPCAANSIVSDDVRCFENWEAMNLRRGLLQGIYASGYDKPTPVQQRAIVPVTEGKDVVLQAESGTGKTATFSISTLQLIDPNREACQAIILATTRELAQQICKVITRLSQFEKIKCCDFIGGRRVDEDIRTIQKSGVQVAVGTPGRIRHLIQSRRENQNPILNTKYVKQIVIDEADEILMTNFAEDVHHIFGVLDQNIQVVLSSATMPDKMLEFAKTNILRQDQTVCVLKRKEELTLQGIKQYYVEVRDQEEKIEVFKDLYETLNLGQSIVFVNTRAKVIYLARYLREEGFTVSEIHSDHHQDERREIIEDFISGKSRVLLSTDILGRGIDIQQVKVVLNYDLPFNEEEYLHRIGRAGRFGRTGAAINLVTDREKAHMKRIEEYYATNIEALPADIKTITQ